MEIQNKLLTWKNVLNLLISLAFTGVLFTIIFYYTNWKQLFLVIFSIPLYLFLLCIIFLLVYFLIRNTLTWLLFKKKIKFSQLYLITLIHNALVVLLPFRVGELSFVYLTRKTNNVTSLEAALVLFIQRLFDIIAVSFILFISFCFLNKTELPFSSGFFYFLTFFLFVLLIFCVRYIDVILLKVYNICHKRILSKFKKTIFLEEKIGEAVQFFQQVQSKRFLCLLFILSLCLWSSYFLISYSIFHYFGFTYGLIIFFLMSSVTVLFSAIPLQGIAGFGNVELGWVFLFILFGMNKIKAIEIAFAGHVIIMVCVMSIGFIAFIFWFVKCNKSFPQQK